MKNKLSGYLFLLNTVVLFSTYEAVSITLVGKLNPFTVNFIRFFIGGLFLLLFLVYKKDVKINKKDLLDVIIVGILNVVLSMNLMQLSLYEPLAKASVSAVIFSSNPVFVFLFSALLEKERLSVYKFAGLFVGLFGVFFIFRDKLSGGIENYKSLLYALLSAILYGLYTVLGKRTSNKIGSLKMNAYSFIAGSLALLPIILYLKIPVTNIDSSSIIQILYLSFLVTGIGYITYFRGLSIIGTSKGSLVFFVKPALASIIAMIFLGEKLTSNLLMGAFFILLGIFVVLYWPVIKEKIIFINHKK